MLGREAGNIEETTTVKRIDPIEVAKLWAKHGYDAKPGACLRVDRKEACLLGIMYLDERPDTLGYAMTDWAIILLETKDYSYRYLNDLWHGFDALPTIESPGYIDGLAARREIDRLQVKKPLT